MTELAMLFVGFGIVSIVVLYLHYRGKKQGKDEVISTQNEASIKKSMEVAKDVQVNNNLTSTELDDKLQQFVEKD